MSHDQSVALEEAIEGEAICSSAQHGEHNRAEQRILDRSVMPSLAYDSDRYGLFTRFLLSHLLINYSRFGL